MKRFHVHVAVDDLPASIAFYGKLFGQAPTKQQPDYAKWMLEDPRVNFAISARGHAAGLNHFGMQVDAPEELAGLKALADAASGGATRVESEAACCYAKSAKHWTLDPQGIAWEHFHTMADAATFGRDTATRDDAGSAAEGACCVPSAAKQEPAACCG